MRASAVGLAAGLIAVAPILMGAGYSAKTNYILHCQGCHGADGLGLVAEDVPPLLNSMGYFTQLPAGRRYLIQVPGAAHAPVSDAELAELINYALLRFSSEQLPEGFEPYTREEVARNRRQKVDVVSMRKALVTEIRRRLGVQLWTTEYPRVPEPGRAHGSLH
jgi:hypothetical protein